MDESQLIRLLEDIGDARGVTLGIGDDAALLEVPDGASLVAATDTLVEGQHLPAGASAGAWGHRVLAVNLSDLAAMGAEPRWALLALTLPDPDASWVRDFAEGLRALARRHGCALVGGDVTRGPRTASLTVLGTVEGRALRRDGAEPGDLVCITGTPGDARLGLDLLRGDRAWEGPEKEALIERYLRPEPRITAGKALTTIATAAIDVSDGLAQDLGRLLGASGGGASIRLQDLPVSDAARKVLEGSPDRDRVVLAGGDDYEILFTLPPERLASLEGLRADWDHDVTVIGEISSGRELVWLDAGGNAVELDVAGWDPMREPAS